MTFFDNIATVLFLVVTVFALLGGIFLLIKLSSFLIQKLEARSANPTDPNRQS